MNMIKIIVSILILIFISGCSGKKYFEPKNTQSASFAISNTGKEAASIMRDGITFTDGTFLTRSGMGKFKLPEGFHYVTQSSKYVLAADERGNIHIYDRNSGKLIKQNRLKMPLISAGIRGDKIYYIQQDNIFGIYSISQNKSLISAKVGRAYAVDTRIANPITVGNLVVVPTLDGKLLIINPSNPKKAGGIAIGKSFNLNNIIFLSKIGNRIIAATPSKVISASPQGMNKFSASVADVTISGGNIYLLTRRGEVIKLSPTLKVLAKKKFNYAQFAAIAVVNGKVYALDRSGVLIVMDSSFKKYRIYDIGSVSDYAFVDGAKLYKDGIVVNLSKLSYE